MHLTSAAQVKCIHLTPSRPLRPKGGHPFVLVRVQAIHPQPVTTFDRHFLREWLTILALVLVATCGLLFVQVAYDDFHNLREAGARGLDFWKYALVTVPSFLAIALPLALLVSVMFVLGKLRGANELTAMRAAGVGFPRLTAPLWVIGVIGCGVAWWLNASVVPWSVQESRVQKEALEFRKAAVTQPPDRIGAVYSVAFDNLHDHRMWFFNRYSEFTHKGYGVSVSELDPFKRETTRWLAAEAWQDDVGGGWVFRDGRRMDFDPETGENMTSTPFAKTYLGRFHEDPELMLLIDRRPIDLSFFELLRLKEYFESRNSSRGIPYSVRYYGLIADILAPLIVIAIAIPFSISGVRVNPAVGVSKSIGLFALYYALESVTQLLATRELLDPALAAWLPNLAMGGLGLVLFLRLR
jgi:lipopolysaccharide export system permease protein